ncbi:hypothetical protein BCV69DRAFT_301478 [Microstroma glucosiphilum]|uniref:Asl1-like glycosyl hydrolase catalytic domain-containing protein n=1 Tax=Pseudomicrostroma glucosiphilum TaxID=1684307 RepID=A0A316TYY2_9BASI|nr:hypothetical protein BCV69DRAFT_301478 [Pseudomicrostroma glucosiphilum]PWN18347.1 hypothetical protein BCV69DRAFT_301478 [Pseudomicrostroma glucosiphilum]
MPFSSSPSSSSRARATLSLTARTAASSLLAVSILMAGTVSAASAEPARGIAWPWFSNTSALTFDGSSWVYNWELYEPTGGPIGSMEFVPMVRTEADLQYLTSYQTVKDASWLMGFNEPDMSTDVGGSNINATYAAQLWKTHIAPLRSDSLKLVAPAVSSSGAAGQGPSWLADFLAACDGCIFDAYAFHPYASNRWGVSALIDNFLELGHTPVWVTEFNTYTPEESGAPFVEYMIDYFNNKTTEEIARYSMISRVAQNTATQADLIYLNGSLTPAGETYNSYEVQERAQDTSTSSPSSSSSAATHSSAAIYANSAPEEHLVAPASLIGLGFLALAILAFVS